MPAPATRGSADRGGIFVDMPRAADNLTVAQADAENICSYLILYKAERIINWEMDRVNNRSTLINVWLSEFYKNEKGKRAEQIRQLSLLDGQ